MTVYTGAIAELVNHSFGITVTFARAAAAERAMYFGSPTFNAGHESAGASRPSTSWFLAEGATGDFFTTFLLLANPGDTVANVTLNYFKEGGGLVTRSKTIPARSRLTVNIAIEDSTLAATAVAEVIRGIRFRKEDCLSEGVRVLRTRDIRDAIQNDDPCYSHMEDLQPRPALTQPGDIVLSPASGRLSAVVDEEGGHILASPLQALRFRADWMDPHVAAAFLESPRNRRLKPTNVFSNCAATSLPRRRF